jgi:hypothetical protein
MVAVAKLSPATRVHKDPELVALASLSATPRSAATSRAWAAAPTAPAAELLSAAARKNRVGKSYPHQHTLEFSLSPTL